MLSDKADTCHNCAGNGAGMQLRTGRVACGMQHARVTVARRERTGNGDGIGSDRIRLRNTAEQSRKLVSFVLAVGRYVGGRTVRPRARGAACQVCRCWSPVACRLLHVVCCLLHVVCCLLSVPRCLLHVARCLLHVVSCMSSLACRLFYVVCSTSERQRQASKLVGSHKHMPAGVRRPKMRMTVLIIRITVLMSK